MKIFKNIASLMKDGITLLEWKRTYAFMRDYETMSELARYVEDVAVGLSDNDLTQLLAGSYDELLANNAISSIPTDAFFNEMPGTFGECLRQMSRADAEVFQKYVAARIFNRLDLDNLKYVVFSGGGEKGRAYPGVLKALDNMTPPEDFYGTETLFDRIKEVSGASAGALISLPVALGFSTQDIEKIVESNNFAYFMDESAAVKSNIVQRTITKQFLSEQVNAELDYLNAFTKVLIDRIVNHMVSEIHESDPESPEELKRWKAEQLAHLETMPFKEVADTCEQMIKYAPVSQWVTEARAAADAEHERLKARGSKIGRNELKPFTGFLNEKESMLFAIRKTFKEDKITAFLEDMVEDRLDQIDEEDLERILPSVTTEADRMLERNVLSLLGVMAKHSFKNVSIDGGHRIGSRAWKRDLIASARQKDNSLIETSAPGWSKLSKLSGVEGKELTTALNAIVHMPATHIPSIGNIVADADRSMFLNIPLIQRFISKPAYDSQRSLYKRNLNFQELAILADELPELGFKKLHVTMTRYQDWSKVFFRPIGNPGAKGSLPKEKCESGGRNPIAKGWDFLKDHEMTYCNRVQMETANADSEKYQRMPLSQAVRISMSIPIGFKPVEYNGEKYVDGGMRSNLPTHPFLNAKKDGHNETLICILGDDEFYRSGKTLKGALRGRPSLGRLWRSMKPEGKGKIPNFCKPIGHLLKWGLSEATYFLNPNYKNLSHDDVLRTIIVRSFGVGMTDFGISEEENRVLIDNAMKNTLQALENGDDVQLSFLMDKLDLLEAEVSDRALSLAKKGITKADQIKKRTRLRPGVFSENRMKSLHGDMGDTRIASREKIQERVELMRGKKRHHFSGNEVVGL